MNHAASGASGSLWDATGTYASRRELEFGSVGPYFTLRKYFSVVTLFSCMLEIID
jgi:hypothetical protein